MAGTLLIFEEDAVKALNLVGYLVANSSLDKPLALWAGNMIAEVLDGKTWEQAEHLHSKP